MEIIEHNTRNSSSVSNSITGGQAAASASVVSASTAAAAIRIKWWKQVGYTVLLFLLLIEWLVPLRHISNAIELEQINPLLWCIGISLVTGLLVKRAWLASLLRGSFTLVYTMWLFGSVVTPQTNGVASLIEALRAGFTRFITAISSDATMMYTGITGGGWVAPSGFMRTLVLLAAVSLLAALVQSLLLHHQSILWFSSATLVYLIVLQGAASVDTSIGIVRAIAWSAALLSWLHLERITADDQTHELKAWPIRWWFTTVLVTWGMVAGFMLWQQAYAWDRPQPWDGASRWLQQSVFGSNSSHTLSSQQARTGYSSDDSELGAGIKDDYRVLFHATTPMPTYWKIETKSVYTGRGWEEPAREAEQLDSTGRLTSPLSTVQDNAWSEPFTQTIQLAAPLSDDMPLVFGGRPERIMSWPTLASTSIGYDPGLDRYRYTASATSINASTSPNNANQASLELSYSYETRAWLKLPLQAVAAGTDAEHATLTTKEQALSRYTLLPTSVPTRVVELAREITAGATSQQQKVERVQAYLRSNYAYTKQETSTPPKDSDFVDHFLFEQKQGYCNHFSTAMIVLLRAEGIPARWVKGFAPGEPDVAGTYTIRASDAHSWVEVYEAAAGWVPYEATPPSALTAEAGQNDTLLARTDVRTAVTTELVVSSVEPVAVKLEQSAEHDTVWERLQAWVDEVSDGVTASVAWIDRAQASIRTQVEDQWGYLTKRSSWIDATEGSSSSQSFMATVQAVANGMWEHARAVVIMIGLLMLGLFLLILHRIGCAIVHAWPRWELSALIRKQRRRYDVHRNTRMGNLAWLLLERQFGKRPMTMSFEEYVEIVVKSKASIELDLLERLQQFAMDSSAMLFAKHQGERALRGRFLQCCADIVRRNRAGPNRIVRTRQSDRVSRLPRSGPLDHAASSDASHANNSS